jgi:hypothetical protein
MSDPRAELADETRSPENAAEVAPARPPADPLSAMTPRFNFVFRWFARRYFSHFDLDAASVARLRELEQKGAVV